MFFFLHDNSKNKAKSKNCTVQANCAVLLTLSRPGVGVRGPHGGSSTEIRGRGLSTTNTGRRSFIGGRPEREENRQNIDK